MTDSWKYNPNLHHRASTRLKGYDYTKAGLYFITICCYDRICRFGIIENQRMVLNEIGHIADEYWRAIPEHFPHVVLHEHIVMPNHVHGILELTDVMTTHDGRTHHGVSPQSQMGAPVGTFHGMSLPDDARANDGTRHGVSHQNQFGKPIAGSVSVIINVDIN